MRRKGTEIVVRSLSSNPQMCIFECFSRSPISVTIFLLKPVQLQKFLTVVDDSVYRLSNLYFAVYLNIQEKKEQGKSTAGAATIASAGAAIIIEACLVPRFIPWREIHH
ncbi:hypothetical protein HAX54_029611 [Datura stramonium]|uniref:Uncharacterized protein n=1 Tax=Datura stramonium TaxID=4076 RepID=A0ABS8V6A6_DATST|nr:hypothetical protein [Datura stramonium]